MLFSGDDGKKRVKTLSGGESARLLFARLMLDQPNVLVLDEPTNHLDLEAIEALAQALESFDGTMILVSHDRWFVSRIATRVVEIRPGGITDYGGTYDEYVHYSGDDHLDVDSVVLKAKREKKKAGRTEATNGDGRGPRAAPKIALADAAKERKRLEKRREELLATLERAEARVAEIDTAFCKPGFYEEAAPEEVTALEGERARLENEVERATEAWDEIELTLDALGV
jgi:ATPase subunit of ABC transporter with duplicated ATPase domains